MRLGVVAAALMAASGCALPIGYRADYLTERKVAPGEELVGRVLIYTTRADDDSLVTAGATNFSNAGNKIIAPMGLMTREIAAKVFSSVATGGVVVAHDLTDAARFTVIVRPENKGFGYGFPRSKNLGLAATPEVQVAMKLSILDASGKTIHERDYASGVVSGKATFASVDPNELINKLLHKTIEDLMWRAAADVRDYQTSVLGDSRQQ